MADNRLKERLSKLTMGEFINYSSFPNAGIIRADLYKRYTKLKMTPGKHFVTKVYTEGKDIYFHVLVPSEVVDNFYYDVVIMLEPTEESSDNLTKYRLSFYSNSPSFMFIYAYIAKMYNKLVPLMEPKVSKQALQNPPVLTNPHDMLFFDKTIMFALLEIRENAMVSVKNIAPVAKPLDKKKFLEGIEDSETKLARRKGQEKELDKSASLMDKIRRGVERYTLKKNLDMLAGRAETAKTAQKTKTTNTTPKSMKAKKTVRK